MERKTFLTSTGAFGASTLLSALRPDAARGATGGPLPARNRTGYASKALGGKPLGSESADLSPHSDTLTDAELHHLLRRAMFGVPESQFETAKGYGSMNAVVAKLLEASDTTKVPLPAKFASWLDEFPQYNNAGTPDASIQNQNTGTLEYYKIQEIENWWFYQIAQENLSLRQKMTLLWTNHFVTGSQTVFVAGYAFAYLMTCMANALGNFKDFAYSISIDPSMLVYLNGDQNYVLPGQSFANENYARELMELFTLGLNDPKTGKPNYTETDIQNSARALTGWLPSSTVSTTTPFLFVGQPNPGLHDSTNKTFLGKTGTWELQDILNIIFEQGTPAGYTAAYWVCQKLYEEFVYYIPNASVVDAMATVMLANNFEIAPVMQALLSSAHFYDASVIGAQLKSPVHYMGSLVREFALTYPAFDPSKPPIVSTDATGINTYGDPNPTLTIVTYILNSQGQELLNPPNVKGWPGGHNWISTGTFENRELYSYYILNNGLANKTNGGLAFNPDSYGLQIPNATSLTAKDLGQTLEAVSLAFTLGPLEAGDLLTKDLEVDYQDPNYQFDSKGIGMFAPALAILPEFQLF